MYIKLIRQFNKSIHRWQIILDRNIMPSFMLDTELAYFWLPDWRWRIHNANLVISHGIHILRFARHNVLLSHVEIYAAVLFHVFIQLSFLICCRQQRGVTVRVLRTHICWSALLRLIFDGLSNLLLDVHLNSFEVRMSQGLLSCNPLIGLLL